jgi:predicted DNA-binding transcriptional regulator AlpA
MMKDRKGNHSADDERSLDTKAAAEHLGVSAKWLEDLRRIGGGPRYLKLAPHCVRYRRRDLRAWLASRERSSTSDPGPGA